MVTMAQTPQEGGKPPSQQRSQKGSQVREDSTSRGQLVLMACFLRISPDRPNAGKMVLSSGRVGL